MTLLRLLLMGLLYYLKEFQTLVAGAVGFAGVILTLRHNARLAREQRDQKARLAQRQREDERSHERSTLRAALLAELKINREAIRGNLERASEGSYDVASGVLVPTDPMNDTYRAFLPKIGLLSEDEVGRVMTAYLAMEAHNEKLYLIGSPSQRSSKYVKLTGEAIEMVRQAQESLLEPVGNAIAALEETDEAVGFATQSEAREHAPSDSKNDQ